jgi:hypothetical protein
MGVLKVRNAGNTDWVEVGGVGANDSIQDEDGDTSIQVEESPDEDIIRMDIAGTQVAKIAAGKVGINTDTMNHELVVAALDGNNAYLQIINDDTGSAGGAGFTVGISNNEDAYLWNYEDTHLVLGTNNQITMLLWSTGEVTKPIQPTFLFTKSGSQTNIAVGGAVTVVWETDITNQGGNFASNTFTAPVAGNYQLNAQIRLSQVDQPTTYIIIYIITSNRNYFWYMEPADQLSADSNMAGVVSVVADMDEGDTAYVSIWQSGGAQQMDINTSSWFSGCLLA